MPAHRVSKSEIERLVMSTPVVDIHTHLYDPAFASLLLWGIDELLVYHYLVAEAFRYLDLPYDRFWSLSKTQQAELIWDSLFIQHSPVSESCRGVLTTLQMLGLDVRKRDLPALRKWFGAQDRNKHLDKCLELAGISRIYMTNSPFDDEERGVWQKGFRRDLRFIAGLRIDPLLLSWTTAGPKLAEWGYKVKKGAPDSKDFREVRRFLEDWTTKTRAKYVMVSLPPAFDYPAPTVTTQLLEKAVLPHCQDHGLPLALMPGVKRAVNPQLGLAGDGVGLSNLSALQNLCERFPGNKFMATVLARENQHELCVLARKFRNLHIFGCWWFTNIPKLIDEITRLRLELLGLSFTPQHSDARVLEQVIYKWRHSREIISRALAEKYEALQNTGWTITRAEVQRDVQDLFGSAFERFCC